MNTTQIKQKHPKFTIIIPAYNEEKSIGEVLRELTEEYKDCAEIIVVDDGSHDNTSSIVSEYRSVKLIRHKTNYGYGASLKTGIHKTKTEILCFFDADSQHISKEVKKIIEEIENADMIIGSRGSAALKNLLRAPGKLILHHVANFLVGQRIPDLNSGLRAVRRSYIMQYMHLLPDGFSASSNMTLIFMLKRYNVKFVPIRVNKRVGKSEVKAINDGLTALMSILRIIVLYNPLKFFIPISVFFLSSGLIYGTYKVFFGAQGLSVGGLLLFFIGGISLFFGLLADQISTMRNERLEDLESISNSRIKR